MEVLVIMPYPQVISKRKMKSSFPRFLLSLALSRPRLVSITIRQNTIHSRVPIELCYRISTKQIDENKTRIRESNLSRANLQVNVSKTLQMFLEKSLGVIFSDLLPRHRITNSDRPQQLNHRKCK